MADERTMGFAVGVFFLCWFCMVAAVNIALWMLYSANGVGGGMSSGGLLCPVTSGIVAAIWKGGSISALAAVIISVVVALVFFGVATAAYL